MIAALTLLLAGCYDPWGYTDPVRVLVPPGPIDAPAGAAKDAPAKGARAQPAGRPPNVVFIVWDTVRADKLALYGNPRDNTPRLSAFAKDAQIAICEKGNRKALGKCRETVQEKVRKYRVEFETCVRSGQAEPSLREADKGDELPEFAQWLDQDDKVTKGWYILLCDPSLPEAGGNAEGNPG